MGKAEAVTQEEVFRTDRLLVRKWRGTDEPAVLALYSDPKVIRWVDDGEALSPSDAGRWMEVTRTNYHKRGYGMFAIERPLGNAPIGFGGLVHPGDQLEPEVKYAFFPNFWRMGYATEFVRGLLIYARGVHGLAQVVATVAEENGASKRVLTKSGFRQSGTNEEAARERIEHFEVFL